MSQIADSKIYKEKHIQHVAKQYSWHGCTTCGRLFSPIHLPVETEHMYFPAPNSRQAARPREGIKTLRMRVRIMSRPKFKGKLHRLWVTCLLQHSYSQSYMNNNVTNSYNNHETHDGWITSTYYYIGRPYYRTENNTSSLISATQINIVLIVTRWRSRLHYNLVLHKSSHSMSLVILL